MDRSPADSFAHALDDDDSWSVDLGILVLRMARSTSAHDSSYVVELLDTLLPFMVEVVGPPASLDTLTVVFGGGVQFYRCYDKMISMGTIHQARDVDDDGDGLIDEDPFDEIDNDGDGAIDEDLTNSPSWDNLFIHELTHAFQDDLLCQTGLPSWLTEGMAEAGRHFVSDLATRTVGNRKFRHRHFDRRMAVYDLYNHAGAQIVGGHGRIADRGFFDLMYQSAAGAVLVPALAEIGAGRVTPHPLSRLTAALRDEVSGAAPHRLYAAIDRAWITPVDGVFPPSRWLRRRAITCPAVRDGEFVALLPGYSRNAVNPGWVKVLHFNRSNLRIEPLPFSAPIRYTGVRGEPITGDTWIPPDLPRGAYLAEFDQPAATGELLHAQTWVLIVHEWALDDHLWPGIAVVFAGADGRPVNVPDLSVNGRIIERVPGGAIIAAHGASAGGALTIHGLGRELATVTVTGNLPRMVVVPIEPRPEPGVVNWSPYEPRASDSLRVVLRLGQSALEPDANDVIVRLSSASGQVMAEASMFPQILAASPTSGDAADWLEAIFPPLDPGQPQEVLLEFRAGESRHGSCYWWPCNWPTAYDLELHPDENLRLREASWEAAMLTLTFEDSVIDEELALLLAEEVDGPWREFGDPPARETTMPEVVRWDLGSEPGADYCQVIRREAGGDDVVCTLAAAGTPIPTTGLADALLLNPSDGVVRWRLALPRAHLATFAVYDANGRHIHREPARQLAAGEQEIWWDGRAGGKQPPAGIYFLRLSGPGIELTRKVVLIPR